MTRIFRISHLPRSGGHMAINWVRAHFPDHQFAHNQKGERWKKSEIIGRGAEVAVVASYERGDVQADLYLLRDFYGHMASRLAYWDRWRENATCAPRPDSVELWKLFARKSSVLTLFPNLAKDRDYRLAEARRLDLPTPDLDPSVEYVDDWGHGSSFDGTSLVGSQLAVDRRHERYVADPRYKVWLDDDEARELNLRHFGWTLTKEGVVIR